MALPRLYNTRSGRILELGFTSMPGVMIRISMVVCGCLFPAITLFTPLIWPVVVGAILQAAAMLVVGIAELRDFSLYSTRSVSVLQILHCIVHGALLVTAAVFLAFPGVLFAKLLAAGAFLLGCYSADRLGLLRGVSYAEAAVPGVTAADLGETQKQVEAENPQPPQPETENAAAAREAARSGHNTQATTHRLQTG